MPTHTDAKTHTQTHTHHAHTCKQFGERIVTPTVVAIGSDRHTHNTHTCKYVGGRIVNPTVVANGSDRSKQFCESTTNHTVIVL